MKSFESLFEELTAKSLERTSGSETVKWLDAGVHTIGKKIVEEAAEVWMAAEHEGKREQSKKSLSSSTTYKFS